MEVDGLLLVIIMQIGIIFALVFLAMFQYFYGEKTKIDLQKGLASFKTMPASIKKQFKETMREELEEMDWSEVVPDVSAEGGLIATLFQNFPYLIQAWQAMQQQGVSGGSLAEAGLNVAADVVKEVVKEGKEQKK